MRPNFLSTLLYYPELHWFAKLLMLLFFYLYQVPFLMVVVPTLFLVQFVFAFFLNAIRGCFKVTLSTLVYPAIFCLLTLICFLFWEAYMFYFQLFGLKDYECKSEYKGTYCLAIDMMSKVCYVTIPLFVILQLFKTLIFGKHK